MSLKQATSALANPTAQPGGKLELALAVQELNALASMEPIPAGCFPSSKSVRRRSFTAHAQPHRSKFQVRQSSTAVAVQTRSPVGLWANREVAVGQIKECSRTKSTSCETQKAGARRSFPLT